MKVPLTISDLTRMQGDHVCIAGYTPERRCIRPTYYPGLNESWLYQDGSLAIRPFATIEFDLIRVPVTAPHSEDFNVGLAYRVLGELAHHERSAWLAQTCSPDVATIFGAPILHDMGYSLRAGTGSCSLGTIRPDSIDEVIIARHGDRWDYRLVFTDGSGEFYNLSITDLAWRAAVAYWRDAEGKPPARLAEELLSTLRDREVFLRVGLSRGWAKAPDRCFLQLNGIHTFPDYLNGRYFADFGLM